MTPIARRRNSIVFTSTAWDNPREDSKSGKGQAAIWHADCAISGTSWPHPRRV